MLERDYLYPSQQLSVATIPLGGVEDFYPLPYVFAGNFFAWVCIGIVHVVTIAGSLY